MIFFFELLAHLVGPALALVQSHKTRTVDASAALKDHCGLHACGVATAVTLTAKRIVPRLGVLLIPARLSAGLRFERTLLHCRVLLTSQLLHLRHLNVARQLAEHGLGLLLGERSTVASSLRRLRNVSVNLAAT